MSLPTELVTAALVGAARTGLPAAAFSPPLAELRDGLSARPPEEGILLLVGAAALHDAAGWLPERASTVEWRLPAYRPEGDRPPCSSEAGRFLERMLGEKDTVFLPELLALLDDAGLRAPDHLLPAVLAHGAKIPRVRPMLLPILGERGRWLGALNPAWRYAAVDITDPERLRNVWNSDPAGRPPLAATVRRRDTAAARRLIETTWRSEAEVVRRELLGVLETGVSMDDEPFLERALDDRDAQVRRKAAELLAHLPESRLVARLTDAAGSILVLRDGILSPSFPGRIPEAMVRDGVTRHENTARPTSTRTATEWSRLLIQTVGAIPLAHWEGRFKSTPEAIIAASQAGKWPRTLMTAFATAALRQRNARWIDALLLADNYTERTGMLLAALAPEDCFARLDALLEARQDESVAVFLRRWPNAWDEPTGRRLIAFFARYATDAKETRLALTLRFLSRQFAQRCPPSLADDAAENLQGRVAGAWESNMKNLLNTLAMRQAMRAAVINERNIV
jgi:hypothetical protein